jgi:heterotetrameric sarcosine oxidase delta subunit
MLRITCPWCGMRDQVEFRYRGDATLGRPPPEADAEAFHAYVYERDNPKGWHTEWWHHVGGCRRVLKLRRHTETHEIAWIGSPTDEPPTRQPPDQEPPGR